MRRKKKKGKPILVSSDSKEDFDSYIALKAQFEAANSSDLFSPIMFGNEAKKAVVHDEISLSNQLLSNKRKSLLKFILKTSERFEKKGSPDVTPPLDFTAELGLKVEGTTPSNRQKLVPMKQKPVPVKKSSKLKVQQN